MPAASGASNDPEISSYQVNKIARSLIHMNNGGKELNLINLLEKNKNIKLELSGNNLINYSADINYDALEDFFFSLSKALIFHEFKKIITSKNHLITHEHVEENSSLSNISKRLISTRSPEKYWKFTNEKIFKYNIDEIDNNFIVDMIFYLNYNISCVLSEYTEIKINQPLNSPTI